MSRIAGFSSGIDYASFYDQNHDRIARARVKLGRPLTLTEKILMSHAVDLAGQIWDRGSATLRLKIDRVALQDATAQMCMLQFMQARRAQVAVPTSIHCDHLIIASLGATQDLSKARSANGEVYRFLESSARKHGIGFWGPGSGIIHQVVLENYAFPGGLMLGTDSHTPNAGGLAMLSCGVGGADAAEVMAGRAWEVLQPKIIGVRLTGRLTGLASAKDVITTLCNLLGTKGGTNCVVEYFGEGVGTISATGRATICNMGAELGATGSLFPTDESTLDYLEATGRGDIADTIGEYLEDLRADEETAMNPGRYYDQVVELDLSTVKPYIVGPHTPDRGRALDELGAEARANGWPLVPTACLIGSCTNSSYRDMRSAAALAEAAERAGLSLKIPLLITPGSERTRATLERDGVLDVFRRMGATILTNACGPCIGRWHRPTISKGEVNSIVSTYNRNFPERNDGNPETLSFLTSPEVVMMVAIAGTIDFDPVNGTLPLEGGGLFSFGALQVEDLPAQGFVQSLEGYVPPADDPGSVEIIISPDSERLQLLEPFAPWDGLDFIELPVLLRARGKTTTDHISPAGPWLDFRGHLERISDNMFQGAENAFTGETGMGVNPITKEVGQPFAQIARQLKASGQRWVVVGDENYGEGSSREHAAMSPRYLGCVVVLVRSFARIHETNLKKQGILPLTFVDSANYDRIGEDDRITITNLAGLAPNTLVAVTIVHPDGTTDEIMAQHTLTAEQITWFKAGSALNTRG